MKQFTAASVDTIGAACLSRFHLKRLVSKTTCYNNNNYYNYCHWPFIMCDVKLCSIVRHCYNLTIISLCMHREIKHVCYRSHETYERCDWIVCDEHRTQRQTHARTTDVSINC